VRIRQVKPEFWRDSKLAGLSARVRLTYIGLWMIADDAGWLRADIAELGVDLWPYEEREQREEAMESAMADLESSGRLMRFPCGHAFLPTLTKHQRLASPEKRVTTVEREHRICDSPRIPAEIRGEQQTLHDAPTRNGTVRNGKERIGTGGEGGIGLKMRNGKWERE